MMTKRRQLLLSLVGAAGAGAAAKGLAAAPPPAVRDPEQEIVRVSAKEMVELDVHLTLAEDRPPHIPTIPWKYDFMDMSVTMPLADYRALVRAELARARRPVLVRPELEISKDGIAATVRKDGVNLGHFMGWDRVAELRAKVRPFPKFTHRQYGI